MDIGARQHGLLKIASGAAAYAVVWYTLFPHGGSGGSYQAIALGAPGALALMGLVELATGTAFSTLETRWADLRRRRRAVYSLSAVVTASLLLFGSPLLYAFLAYG